VSGSAEPARRVLVTGADTFWGGRVAQAFEAQPDVEVVVGIGSGAPLVPLSRTDFVRVTDQTYSSLHRIIGASGADTVVHTGLVVDSTLSGPGRLHDTNVIGKMNLLAAAGAPGSSVRALVVKSSGLVYGASAPDPYAFAETTMRTATATTPLERTLIDAERLVRDFAQDNPEVQVSLLRFANVLGPDLKTPLSRNLSGPLCPSIFGYDPLLQFVEQGDVVRAIVHARTCGVPGTFNVGGAGRLPLSEVAAICGTRLLALPPWRTAIVAAPLVRLGLFDLPPELLALLRYGRGLDPNAFVRRTGFVYRYASADAVQAFARVLRLRRGVGTAGPAYRYQEDVERFLRQANSVARRTTGVGEAG
jgi:UDP-glucose 4-epimerase